MNSPEQPAFLRWYGRVLKLYPAEFQTRFAGQALLTATDCYDDAKRQRRVHGLTFRLAADVIFSLVHEHRKHIGRQIMKRPIMFHTAGLAVVLTALGFFAAIACQQMLRRGANQPQRQMVEMSAAKIAGGAPLSQVIPNYRIDLADGLEPFRAFYDEQGNPLRSTGYLDSAAPVPPSGVFEYLRRHGSHTVTWQPRAGVRIAAVARKVDGPRPGFLLAGRSLRVTEEYEGALRLLVFAGWFAVMAILLGSAFLLNLSGKFQL